MTKGPVTLIEALYAALHSPLGVVLSSSVPDKLRQKLYAERKKLADPQLDSLRFATSRTMPESELLIVKKGEPNAD
tara:strand:- start:3037 stop:3264 length:228 start_codon:yes stop_codon:yes gene_type:complete